MRVLRSKSTCLHTKDTEKLGGVFNGPGRPGGALAGFTMVELLIVLLVVSILGALATTNYLKRLPEIRSKSAARQLWMDLKRAQNAALSKRMDVVVLFDTSKNTYDILLDNNSDLGPTGTPQTTGAGADSYISRDRELPVGISFASGIHSIVGIDSEAINDGVSLDNNRLFFQPSGRCSFTNLDAASTIVPPTRRAVYVIPAGDISNQNVSRMWAVTVNGASGLPEMRKYSNGWGN